MSKENNFRENQTIYEIFRACRLCGAGGGYKMPIIQNVVAGFECSDVELRQKIQECVQIEVKEDDKMPPLICELCVDKVNDYYEFLDMCHQTNKRTRLRLGLPPQNMQRGAPDPGDCILGLTEPVYVHDSDSPPPSPARTLTKKIKEEDSKKAKEVPLKKMDKPGPLSSKKLKDTKKEIKVEKAVKGLRKELEDLIKSDVVVLSSSRASRSSGPESRPSSSASTGRSALPPSARETRRSNENVPPTRSKHEKNENTKSTLPKSILKKEVKKIEVEEESSLLVPRKRTRESNPIKEEVAAAKKVKITIKLPRPPSPAPAPATTCRICRLHYKSKSGLSAHLKQHIVTYTPAKEACNACGEWFESAEAALAHHRRHRAKNKPYRCRHCRAHFPHERAYDEHFEKAPCARWVEVPDVKCERCWRSFPTRAVRTLHRCPGEDGRPGGKCSKCNKSYLTMKNLRKHAAGCKMQKRNAALDGVNLDRAVRGRLRSMTVRVARCDSLLAKGRLGRCIADIPQNFGLDPSCYYPYLHSRVKIKTEPLERDGMVRIKQEIKDEFYIEEDYVHWDSDLSSDSENEADSPFERTKRVDSLSILSLKTIFSRRCLGKVPRKLRKLKSEKIDAFFNESDDNISSNISSIIDNLDNDESNDSGSLDKSKDSDTIGNDTDNDGTESNDGTDSNDVTVSNDGTESNDGTDRNDVTVSNDDTEGNDGAHSNDVTENNDVTVSNDGTESDVTENNDGTVRNNDVDSVKGIDSNGYNTDSSSISNYTSHNIESLLADTQKDPTQNGVSPDKYTIQNAIDNSEQNADISIEKHTNSLDSETEKLMDELNAQIGEANAKTNNLLDDLISKANAVDSISDADYDFES